MGFQVGDFGPAWQAQIRAALKKAGVAVPVAEATPAKAKGGMNKWERLYAAHLAVANGVVWWGYEPVRLLLAQGEKRAWFTPDFCVVTATGQTEFHEVKGYWREAARLRIKVAAGLYPWRFVAVTRKGGTWAYEEFRGNPVTGK